MLRTAFILLSTIAMVGCQGAQSVSTVRWAPSGNLLFSRNADVQVVSEWMTTRATWPAVNNGYQFDDVTTTTTFEYDDQFFQDRLGGSFLRQSESVRTGVWVR